MEQQQADGEAGRDARSPGRIAVFVAALSLYYVLYYWIFAARVSEYFGDILKHFAFVRRWLP
jgi:hypothetical protein